jgi:amino acid adenylation domain-containing protein
VAASHPSSTALRSPAGEWSYEELARDVRNLAGGVQEAVAAGQAEPVAVLATHDGPLVVAILGVVAAGQIVVVVDPVAPVEQATHVLRESGARLLLHDEANAPAAAALTGSVDHECRAFAIDAVSGAYRAPDVDASSPAMLAFTSGTSGAPKAGVITHGVLLNLVRGATNALGIGPHDRMPMLFPTSLAVAAYPMFLPLLNGGTLATLDVRSVGLEPVAGFLEDERITLAYMAPTVVRFLVDALAGRTFPDLRMIALGGELVDSEVVALTTDLFGPSMLANGFGTTETGVITLFVFEPGTPLEGPVPAGFPVPEVDLFVLDDEGQVLPTGTAGEVAISSPYVFQGYWGHDELSDQVLSDDPEGRPGWRLYRTGDLGRVDDRGCLTVLGRLDTKVKVRGRFVVLGDVEGDLHALPAVADAAVVPVDHGGVVELAAVVVPASGEELDPPAVRASLLERQEAYRVPSRWCVVDELPRLPNGKVDRHGLKRLAEAAGPGPSAPGTASTTPRPGPDAAEEQAQQELHELWELLLPTRPIGLDDEFEHLGGHSLLAAQMLVIFEQRTGTIVPMSAMVDHRTIRRPAGAAPRSTPPRWRWCRMERPSAHASGSYPTSPALRTGCATRRATSATTSRCGASSRPCCAANPTGSPTSTSSWRRSSPICGRRSPRGRTGSPATRSVGSVRTRWRASSASTGRRWPSWG